MIEGEVELHLDSGEMRTLRKGDCIVQRGEWIVCLSIEGSLETLSETVETTRGSTGS